LEALDDPAPTRSVRPSAVDENDVRSTVHLHTSFSGASKALAGGPSDLGLILLVRILRAHHTDP